jgi:hypothetical protein
MSKLQCLYEQIGPFFPPLELQARWITYVWSGIRRAPSREEMSAGIAEYRSKPQTFTMRHRRARSQKRPSKPLLGAATPRPSPN